MKLRCLTSIAATSFFPLILKADGKGTSLYINGTHAVHRDTKGHGGVCVTTGTTGAIYASSTKIKIITVSSTETAVVISVSEKLPKHLWLGNFAVEQSGDPLHRIYFLYQDNKSIIILV